MAKNIVVLLIVGTIVYFCAGWVVFDLLLGGYTDANTTQIAGFKKSASQFSIPYLVLSCAAYAGLMVYILVYLTRTRSLVRGTVTGAITGVLVAVMADAYWLASSNFYNNVLVALADVAAAAITVGFLGFAITYTAKRIGAV